MKYWPFAALFMGLVLPVSATDKVSANHTNGFASTKSSASLEATVGKEEGIVTIPSNHSADETVDKLKGILQAKGVTIFALIDHSGEAAKVGMKMPPTKLLIFGSPKGRDTSDARRSERCH